MITTTEKGFHPSIDWLLLQSLRKNYILIRRVNHTISYYLTKRGYAPNKIIISKARGIIGNWRVEVRYDRRQNDQVLSTLFGKKCNYLLILI